MKPQPHPNKNSRDPKLGQGLNSMSDSSLSSTNLGSSND